MLRYLNYIIGAAFAFVLLLALWGTASELISNPPEETAEEVFHLEPMALHLQSDGPFGTYDLRQVQRGFQVYKEVCSACHSLKQVAFRDLQKIGYSEAQVKAIAADWQIEQPGVNKDTGEAATRPNVPADRFPLPFANDVAARAANNNAIPPDLSLMAKAREGGPAYIHSLLVGYTDPKTYTHDGKALMKEFPDFSVPTGLHFNPYFANLNIAMPPPLTQEGQVQYQDGTRPTINQMAKDVSAFLMWAAEPNLTKRHATGVGVVLFLLIFIGLTFGAYRNVWRGIKH
ncbi:cytochrome c1 [Stakelama sp. CBK3Z-3]|uniref:Cytochrome c1 n=1 Tax=Stakelama flava TaxID=2860338 RepID=A0ABS6XHY2_9SPHN|nr:cytochrome c1 [Stakelama flava]